MTIAGKILKGIGNVGKKIVGAVGNVLGFGDKVTTDYQAMAATVRAELYSYDQATQAYQQSLANQKAQTQGVVLPQWVTYVGGGIAVLVVLKLLKIIK